jgi:O-antigen ligase
MRGITGSPNSIGGEAALGIMMVTLYWREYCRRTRYLCAFSVLVFLAAIVLSQSRSPIAAVLVILLCNAFFRPGRGALAIAGGILGVASFIAIFPFIDSILALLSRSGSAEEILTATGRSEIWAVVIDLWTQKPIHGWGYGAMLYILPTYPGLFEAAAHAHNLYLEVLVGGGVIGLGLLLLAIASTLFWGIRVGDRRALALVFFILLRGITEAAPFSGVAGFTYLALTLGVAMISHKQTVRRHTRLGFAITPRANVPAQRPPA